MPVMANFTPLRPMFVGVVRFFQTAQYVTDTGIVKQTLFQVTGKAYGRPSLQVCLAPELKDSTAFVERWRPL